MCFRRALWEQARDAGLVEVHAAVGVVITPQEIHENEDEEKREEGNEGLEDGLSLACIVLASHEFMLMQAWLSPGDVSGLEDDGSEGISAGA